MTKVLKYALAYVLWILDLGLGLWLLLISRTAFLNFLAVFYKPGNLAYAHRVDFADKVFTLILGLGWLILMIVIEHSYRTSALTGELPQRFARVSGVLLLCAFVVDMIMFWIQGVGNGDWLRWLILVAELGIGTALMVAVRSRFAVKS
jgi:hypothetical protein